MARRLSAANAATSMPRLWWPSWIWPRLRNGSGALAGILWCPRWAPCWTWPGPQRTTRNQLPSGSTELLERAHAWLGLTLIDFRVSNPAMDPYPARRRPSRFVPGGDCAPLYLLTRQGCCPKQFPRRRQVIPVLLGLAGVGALIVLIVYLVDD